ncbi:MAG: hypothetical protein IPQ01_00860 [Zoogloea sp.]|jgi:hypothetical protein|nr:hypothetical protein [Zoogloea sp.]
MAAPWFALFSAIPWTDVITHAPTVAKGAKKLWQQISSRKAADTETPGGSTVADPVARPEARIAALETRLAESDARQQESAELLAALASQNADLVRATEELRRRVRILSIGLGIALPLALAALAISFQRPV